MICFDPDSNTYILDQYFEWGPRFAGIWLTVTYLSNLKILF